MKRKTKLIISSLVLTLSFACVFFAPSNNVVSAQIKSNICDGAELSVSGTDTSGNKTNCPATFKDGKCLNSLGQEVPASQCSTENTLNSLIANIVNILSIIVGIVAVIMIIIGGFKYITSAGDSGNISSAKTTIIYAIVGLIIVALAQVIVRFVLAKAT